MLLMVRTLFSINDEPSCPMKYESRKLHLIIFSEGFSPLLFKYIHYQRYSALEKPRQSLVLLCKEFKILTKVFTNKDAETCSVSFKTPNPSIQN